MFEKMAITRSFIRDTTTERCCKRPARSLPSAPIEGRRDYPVHTEEAAAWAADLKKRGFTFLGPTVVYAHMQAVGMVNDHVVMCFRYSQIASTRDRRSPRVERAPPLSRRAADP
jgi:hypothetical protein